MECNANLDMNKYHNARYGKNSFVFENLENLLLNAFETRTKLNPNDYMYRTSFIRLK